MLGSLWSVLLYARSFRDAPGLQERNELPMEVAETAAQQKAMGVATSYILLLFQFGRHPFSWRRK